MRSIRRIGLKLTLWGTGITLAVCLLVCGALYAGVWYSLHREVDSFLEGEVHEFMGIVREYGNAPQRAEQEIRTHLGSRSRSDLRFRVFDEAGRLLITSDPQDPVPISFLLSARAGRTVNQSWFGTFDVRGEAASLRVCSMVVPGPLGRLCIAQASYSLDRLEGSLATLRKVAAMSLLIAAVLAIIAGRIFASRSLAPLHQITSKARHISARRLSERLPRSHNGDEFDQLAQVLNELLDCVEIYVKKMQQFTADASHELRSPLAALRGSAEVALTRERSPEELRRVLEDSVEHYDRLVRIAEDLLLLARLDSGEAVFRRERVDLSKAVEDVVDLFAPLAAERGIELHVKAATSGAVEGDPGRLRQVISNILDNAIKYTAAPGSVTVDLSRHNGSIELKVADSGIGINPNDLPRIFDRFYRVDRARSRESANGAGLGLAICRSIIEAHQGQISLDSRPGQGTTVTVIMPPSDRD